MTPELLNVLRDILQLGWPALVTVMVIVLWKKLESLDEKLHDCLQERDIRETFEE